MLTHVEALDVLIQHVWFGVRLDVLSHKWGSALSLLGVLGWLKSAFWEFSFFTCAKIFSAYLLWEVFWEAVLLNDASDGHMVESTGFVEVRFLHVSLVWGCHWALILFFISFHCIKCLALHMRLLSVHRRHRALATNYLLLFWIVPSPIELLHFLVISSAFICNHICPPECSWGHT